MAPRAGDRHGIELEVAEAPDDGAGGLPGPLPAAVGTAGEPGPLRLQEPGPGQCQTAGGYRAASPMRWEATRLTGCAQKERN